MGSRCGEETILHHMFHRCVRLNYLGALTVMINLVADGILISHFLGGQAAAAFGLVMPVYSLLNLFPCLLRTSAQAKLGAHIGRGDVDGAGQCVFYLLASGIAAAIPLGLLLSLFRGTMIAVLCARADYDEQTVLWASEYLLCFAPAVFPLMLCAVLHPLVQIDGDEERSPRAIQIATTINLLGDLVNVMLFHGGLAGMALTSTLSCYGELLVLLMHFRRPGTAVHLSAGGVFSAEKLFQLSEGIPLMLRELCAFLSGISLNRLASRMSGEDGVAVLAIAGTLWVFLLPGAVAVSGACMTMGSISSGEADARGVHRVSALGRWYAFIPGTAYAALFILLSGHFAVFCTGGEDRLLELLLPYLRCMAMTFPFVCFCQTVEAMLIVRGRIRHSAVLGLLDGGTIVLAASMMCCHLAGVKGLWLGRLLGGVLLALAAFFFEFRTEARSRKGTESAAATENTILDTTVYSEEETAAYSEKLQLSARRCGCSRRNAGFAALCMEELVCNTLRWGYQSGKNNGVDVRAVCRGEDLILRFRDTGRLFDPTQYIRQFRTAPQDPAKNVGLRIVSGTAAEMRYITLLDCNIVILRFAADG
ncbi:MAG: ATP-binding protein [Clostridium sp.]|nr:ATP-binding protein [Clostridium sp.]